MKRVLALSVVALLVGCQQMPPQPLKTQLQIREFQTRSFEVGKADEVMSALVEAFQDQGFMVKNVVPQVGLVSAVREVDVEDSSEAMLKTFMMGQNATWGKNVILEATANVRSQGNSTKVRLTFQEKILNNHGNAESIKIIEDAKFYQDFFDKVGKSIFIEKNK